MIRILLALTVGFISAILAFGLHQSEILSWLVFGTVMALTLTFTKED